MFRPSITALLSCAFLFSALFASQAHSQEQCSTAASCVPPVISIDPLNGNTPPDASGDVTTLHPGTVISVNVDDIQLRGWYLSINDISFKYQNHPFASPRITPYEDGIDYCNITLREASENERITGQLALTVSQVYYGGGDSLVFELSKATINNKPINATGLQCHVRITPTINQFVDFLKKGCNGELK